MGGVRQGADVDFVVASGSTAAAAAASTRATPEDTEAEVAQLERYACAVRLSPRAHRVFLPRASLFRRAPPTPSCAECHRPRCCRHVCAPTPLRCQPVRAPSRRLALELKARHAT